MFVQLLAAEVAEVAKDLRLSADNRLCPLSLSSICVLRNAVRASRVQMSVGGVCTSVCPCGESCGGDDEWDCVVCGEHTHTLSLSLSLPLPLCICVLRNTLRWPRVQMSAGAVCIHLSAAAAVSPLRPPSFCVCVCTLCVSVCLSVCVYVLEIHSATHPPPYSALTHAHKTGPRASPLCPQSQCARHRTRRRATGDPPET